jgi:hypothetical protein
MQEDLKTAFVNIEELLSGTRMIKKVFKGLGKSHTKLKSDYVKYISACNINKQPVFQKILESYKKYIKSFVNFNDKAIEAINSSYGSLKSLAFELKSNLSVLKIEKKTIEKIKNDPNEASKKNCSDIINRCEDLSRSSLENASLRVTDAVNSHLFALKCIRKGVDSDHSHLFASKCLRKVDSDDSRISNSKKTLENILDASWESIPSKKSFAMNQTSSIIQNVSRKLSNININSTN